MEHSPNVTSASFCGTAECKALMASLNSVIAWV
jgi:hypothetical protein